MMLSKYYNQDVDAYVFASEIIKYFDMIKEDLRIYSQTSDPNFIEGAKSILRTIEYLLMNLNEVGKSINDISHDVLKMMIEVDVDYFYRMLKKYKAELEDQAEDSIRNEYKIEN